MSTYFTSLPNELLINIFNHLFLSDLLAIGQISPRFEEVVNLVCSKKRRLIFCTSMPSLFRRILEPHVHRAMAEQTSLPMNFAPDEILHLELDSYDKLFQLPANFALLFPHITQLIIIADTLQNHSGSNYKVLNSLLASLPRLELLKLVTMAETSLLIHRPPPEPLPLLKHLSLYCFMERKFQANPNFYETFPNLEELYLTGFTASPGPDFGGFKLDYFPSLRRLGMHHLRSRVCSYQLEHIDIQQAANIQHLDILIYPSGLSKTADVEIPPELVKMIIRLFPNLLSFNGKMVELVVV